MAEPADRGPDPLPGFEILGQCGRHPPVPHTVPDHLKAVFGKVGGDSRRELAATIFDQYHWPRFGPGNNAPESDGAISSSYAADGALV